MPRYKKTEREGLINETRQLLIESAINAFAEHGYQGANVNDISRSAGYAKGTIYNYFKSKRVLMLAALEEISDQHLTYIRDRVLREDDPVIRLARFFEAGFAFITDHLTRARVMLSAINSTDNEFRQLMFEAYAPMFQLIGEDIVGVGIAQGVFRDVDITTTAGLIMNLYLGTGSMVNDDGHPWLPPSEISDFVLRSIDKT